MRVKNLKGSGTQFSAPTCKCNSWIAHWDINKYPSNDKEAGWCRGCGEKLEHSKLRGGHVIKIKSSDECRYIIPLCASCNGLEDGKFEVDVSDLVSANCINCVTNRI